MHLPFNVHSGEVGRAARGCHAAVEGVVQGGGWRVLALTIASLCEMRLLRDGTALI